MVLVLVGVLLVALNQLLKVLHLRVGEVLLESGLLLDALVVVSTLQVVDWLVSLGWKTFVVRNEPTFVCGAGCLVLGHVGVVDQEVVLVADFSL